MENKYKPIPFWSWNDELDEKELVKQIDWMHENGIGGFFMHARGGLTTPYLGDKWFKCIDACLKRALELNMEAYAYDENGWPSGFAGGKLLEDESNLDTYLTYKIGEYDKNAAVSFDLSGDSLKKTNGGKNVLNVYLNVSNSTVDICNKEVVKKFINLTHEEYKERDIYHNLRGFFTDEPQYYRAHTPFTRCLIQYFKEQYHEDVFERIGLLFVDKEGYEDYRYKYYKAMQDLMLNSFAMQIYDWCDLNGYKLTGHYIEEQGLGKQILCCGGVMPFYEYEHIPGIDHLGREVLDNISARQLGSVMAQLGKKHGLCELFACAGWDATPLELKKIAEYYMVNGVNTLCYHLLPYSEHGQRKRDYPEHYSKINPWVEEAFKDFNDYFSERCELLANSQEVVEVGIIHPIRSAYFSYKRELEWGTDFGCKELTDNLLDISNKLSNNGVQFHYLDETIMSKHAHVDGDKLVIGKYEYKYVIIPKGMVTMDVSTMELLKKYLSNGGKIYIVGDKPTYLEGKKFNHEYLVNNSTFEEILRSKPFGSSYNESVRIAYRVKPDGTPFIYAFNMGDETEISVSLKNKLTREENQKLPGKTVHFDKCESKILYLDTIEDETEQANESLKLDSHFDVIGNPTNYLTLDYLKMSVDGKNYSNSIHHQGIQYNLLKKRYSGGLFLKYEFFVKNKPSHIEALIEDTHILNVFINGVEIFSNGSVLEKDLKTYDLSDYVKIGNNEVVIKINFFESGNVYYALFGENVQESIKNCMVYDTTIEAIYLRGDFGVFGDFSNGKANDILIANKFYLDKPKQTISSLIKDGYPFFRGKISLRQDIEVKNPNKTLIIQDRFQLVDLYVNDVFVKRLMFDYKTDLSRYLKIGKNTIRLDLIVSNRNLLGPFHDREEEQQNVGPYSFERFGSWDEEGHSYWCLDRYSFVKTII